MLWGSTLSLVKVLFYSYDSDGTIDRICIKVMRDVKHGYRACALVSELDTKEIISGQNNSFI